MIKRKSGARIEYEDALYFPQTDNECLGVEGHDDIRVRLLGVTTLGKFTEGFPMEMEQQILRDGYSGNSSIGLNGSVAVCCEKRKDKVAAKTSDDATRRIYSLHDSIVKAIQGAYENDRVLPRKIGGLEMEVPVLDAK